MIENFEQALNRFCEKKKEYEQMAQQKRGRKQKPFPYQLRELKVQNAKEISDLYQEYKYSSDGLAHPTFLYIPSEEEIINAFRSDHATYLGMLDNNNEVVGVVKIERYADNSKPYFFRLPKSERFGYNYVYGISGLYVTDKAKQHSIGKKFVECAIGCLHWLGAKGVYADCDFRNFKSFKSLSPYLDLIGFTDGRNGAEGEKTIYTTFYHSYTQQPTREFEGKVLDYAGEYDSNYPGDMDGVACLLLDQLKDMGGCKCSGRVIYPEGASTYNEIYVLNTPVKTKGLRLTLGEWNNEYIQDFKQTKEKSRSSVQYKYSAEFLDDFAVKPKKQQEMKIVGFGNDPLGRWLNNITACVR